MYIEELSRVDIRPDIVKILKALGVKNVLKKFDNKPPSEKRVEVYHVFKTSLELLEKESTNLLQSSVPVEIPVFVIDSCRFIEQNLVIEGLFRKAGSTSRQRELRAILDCGNRLELNSDHSVINVANILKLFFRELPEPLIPFRYHDMFLRCLLLKENKVDAILFSCLLLPPDHLNTLAYLMQFLSHVSMNSNVNRMDVGNLSIIFTPSIMPVNAPKLTPHGGERINHHVQVVRLLIENASLVGVVPEGICYKHRLSQSPSSATNEDSDLCDPHKYRKKKKRSGSLTRMLSGIKKIITKPNAEGHSPGNDLNPHTPRIVNSVKKRRSDTFTFSSKKRRDVLSALPQCLTLANTPYRIRKAKTSSTSLLSPRVLVAKSSKKSMSPQKTSKKKASSTVVLSKMSPKTTELSCSSGATEVACKSTSEDGLPSESNSVFPKRENQEYVRIPKEEYEEIKNRVSLIESRIENELDNILGVTLKDDDEEPSPDKLVRSNSNNKRKCMDSVQNVYVKTVKQSEKLNNSAGELSRKFGRDLRIRRSGENRVIRSPSARKIGSIRRRSRENCNLKRDVTRHVSLNCDRPCAVEKSNLRPSRSLRRGRPNTVYSGLPFSFTPSTVVTEPQEPSVQLVSPEPFPVDQNMEMDCDPQPEGWQGAQEFFDDHPQSDAIGTGRESVAKIRTQNMGMVLAKAKLFDAIMMNEQSVAGLQRLLLPNSCDPVLPPSVLKGSQSLLGDLNSEANISSPLKDLNRLSSSTPNIKRTLNIQSALTPKHYSKIPSLVMSRNTPVKACSFSTPRRSPRLAALKAYQSPLSPSKSFSRHNY